MLCVTSSIFLMPVAIVVGELKRTALWILLASLVSGQLTASLLGRHFVSASYVPAGKGI